MSDLTKFSEGAAILQQVDVSDIFMNLAMGIAEAQQKLDDNSVAQAIRLAQTQINGVSLLTMGFQPMFYAFQYADISASINLKMAMKEALEFGFGIDLKLCSRKGYSETDQKFLSKESYSETKEEYKTSRDLNFRAKEGKKVKINNKEIIQQQQLSSKTRLETFKQDIMEQASIEQIYEDVQTLEVRNNESRGIDVWVDRGFLRIEESLHYKKDGIGILKIKDYSVSAADKSIDVNGTTADGSFVLGTDLLTSLDAADEASVLGTNGQLFGLSKDGQLYEYVGSNWVPISSTIYFEYNKDRINYTDNLKYTSDPVSATLTHAHPTGAIDNKNHNRHLLIHKILRLIQSNDSSSKIFITGMTDPKGGDNKNNKSLAKRRAENLCHHIFGGTPSNVVINYLTNSSGGSNLLQRYAKIELDCDYMIFVHGNVNKNATPGKASPKLNKFVFADDRNSSPFHILNIDYGNYQLRYTENTDFSEVITHVRGILQKDSYEKHQELNYFLHDEAIVKFELLTNTSEEISIEHDTSESTDQSSSEDSYISSKTRNEQSELSDNVTKNSKNDSFALDASVDFRMAKQFEMSMEGNASMSARLVAVPAPPGFVTFIQNIFILNNSGNIDIN